MQKNINSISNFDLSGSVGDALGELLGKSSPNPSKPFNNILFKLRRFIKPHRVAPALSLCYRVASHSTQQTHLQWRYPDKERGILKGERIAKNSATLYPSNRKHIRRVLSTSPPWTAFLWLLSCSWWQESDTFLHFPLTTSIQQQRKITLHPQIIN